MPISHNILFTIVSIFHFKEFLMLSDYDHQVLRLTEEFYDKYPNPPYTERETKESRRYRYSTLKYFHDILGINTEN